MSWFLYLVKQRETSMPKHFESQLNMHGHGRLFSEMLVCEPG